MITITRKQWANIPTDYKGTWTNQDHPEYIGRKIVFSGSLHFAAGLPQPQGESGTALHIEGVSFAIA